MLRVTNMNGLKFFGEHKGFAGAIDILVWDICPRF